MIVLWIVIALIIAILLAVCIWFTVTWVQILLGIKKALTVTGYCIDGQTDCDNVSDDTLGFPLFEAEIFVRNDARIYADLVGRLEYASKNKVTPTTPPGFTLVRTLNDKYGDMFIGLWTTSQSNSVQLYVVVRGTQTESEWKKDLEASQVVWPTEPCQVHKGFLDVYNQNRMELLESINSIKPSFIVFTGHSLGAAVATLASVDMATTKLTVDPIMVSYVFASPRVGNVEFSTFADSNVKLYRIVNNADLVNDLPFPVHPNIRGKHIPFIYQHAGTAVTFDINWGSIMNNHLIPIYKNCLEDPKCSLGFDK